MTSFIESFLALFVAEFGDKTQLAVITLTASTGKPWAVFLGASLALAVGTALGVVFGHVALKIVPGEVLHRIAPTAL
ncbi:MAG: TMEM165/GDT1 family protein, partial [Elusimicrobia bacterium]|nr:TMEM165/GDT1 family protein [Elusimicrobiota bacterium]